MQERLDKLYDEITDIENAIEEVETRLYNIRQDKISEDNVYQFLLFFDKPVSYTHLYSKPLRDFCGFTKVPDASKITRFKQDFLDDLQLVFDQLVDITEPICQAVDSAKADMTIFDSSGIEAFVTENNPKYANRIIKMCIRDSSNGMCTQTINRMVLYLFELAKLSNCTSSFERFLLSFVSF